MYFNLLLRLSESCAINNANNTSYWSRNTGKTTIEERYDSYAYEQVWTYINKVQFVYNLDF